MGNLQRPTSVHSRQLGTMGKTLAPTEQIDVERSSNSEFQVWNLGLFLELQLSYLKITDVMILFDLVCF
jgi:hypothetical protein